MLGHVVYLAQEDWYKARFVLARKGKWEAKDVILNNTSSHLPLRIVESLRPF